VGLRSEIMSIKRMSTNIDKKIRQGVVSLKVKSANELTDADKDSILIYLAKKFNLIKKD